MQLSPEQLEATSIDANLVVNAGAGSGKTTVLTHRYVRLVEEGGLMPEQIVAITFTRKAAREMRERIDQRLAERAADGSVQWKQAREQLVSAPIGTIHSFYARILRAFPVEAGIDPGFRVLEELETGMLLNEALGAMLEEAAAEGNADLNALAAVLGAQAFEEEGSLASQLRTIYQLFLNRGIPMSEAALSGKYSSLPDWKQCRDKFAAIVDGEAELAHSLAGKDKPDMVQARRSLAEAKHILYGASQPQDFLKWYGEMLPLTQLKGGRTKGHKEFVNGATEQLRMLLSGALAPVLGRATLSLLLRLDHTFKQVKARSGALDFSDLQLAVWQLLKNYPQIIRTLRSRYRTYMIDEFQDTDRLQHRIIAMLVEEDGDIPPGRLFVVGDEKQSIYRFRGAEVKVFDEVRRKLTRDHPSREKRITCNYRSQQPLIDLVNALFSQLMDKGQDSEIEYINLSAHRTGSAPCAELVSCVPDEGEAFAEAEARMLAARIEEMAAGEEITVTNKDGPRPLRFGDIAVLVRSRTHLKEYEHNLRLAGIPYTVVGGVGFYQQQEVQDLINLLRVVGNLRDELALAAVLRSPLFALDDDSLLILAEARLELGGTLLDHDTALSPEPRRRLQRATEIINTLRQARGRWELPRLVEEAMDLTLARELNLTRFAGLQRYANLEKFLDLAAQYSSIGNNNLTGFLQWLDYAANMSEAEAQVDSDESDSVKIMTIHASKGLEFPVVFLPACSTALLGRYGSMLVDEEGGLAFRYPWQCPVWKEICDYERLREQEEFKRLLYVAVTRARDRLVALVRETGRNETSFNIWLQEFALKAQEHFLFNDAPGQGRVHGIQFPQSLPDPADTQSSQGEELFTSLKPLGNGRRRIRYFSISQFMLWRQDRELFDRRYLSRWLDAEPKGLQEERGGDWEHEPGGTSFGSLLHNALEVIGPETDLPSLLRDLVSKHFPEADQTQQDSVFYSARTLLEAYQREPGVQGNFSQSISEQEFYYRQGDVLFYGLMDRVMIGHDHVVVLDYKSNRIPEEGVQPLLDAYTPQLQFYALAAEKIYKKPVRAYLQLLRKPPGQQLVEISLAPAELQKLQSELEQFVEYCQG